MKTIPLSAPAIALLLLPIAVGCSDSSESIAPPAEAVSQAAPEAAASGASIVQSAAVEPGAPEQPSYDHSDSDEQQISYLQQSFSTAAMEDFELLPIIRRIYENQIPLAHQQIIYTILANTNEVAIHQMRGEIENRVLINPDGREAVYDINGDLLSNGYNDGTFNYANAKSEPLLHYTMDTSPWIQLGISTDDPTSVMERIYAYMGDLEGGIVRAHRSRPLGTLDEDHRWSDTGEIQAMALFMKVIEAGEAQELFGLFKQSTQPTAEELISVLSKLNRGFDQVYIHSEP